MRPEDFILAKAFNLGLLSIEFVPELRGARNLDGSAQVVPPQVVLRAYLAGASVRLCSAPLDVAASTAKEVSE